MASQQSPSNRVHELAEQLVRGELSLERFLAQLVEPKTADLGAVRLDLDRRRRCGLPEVIFGEGKSLATLQKLIGRMLCEGIDVFATRISSEKSAILLEQFPAARYNALARTLRIAAEPTNSKHFQSQISTLK